jgi:hypothetical protein
LLNRNDEVLRANYFEGKITQKILYESLEDTESVAFFKEILKDKVGSFSKR